MALDRTALSVYLSDHLAASCVALDFMEKICTAHADTRMGTLLTALKEQIEEEQSIVRSLLECAGGVETTASKAAVWLSAKVLQMKIGAGENDESGIVLFETLEALSVGFWGRRALWRTLDNLGSDAQLKGNIDYAALARRTEKHLEELEQLRLEASVVSLTQGDPVLAI